MGSKKRFFFEVLLLSIVYYGSAKLGVRIGALKGNVAPLWPPTGIAIAVVLIRGPRYAIGVFVGALAFNGTTGGVPILVALGMAIGNTAECLAAKLLINRNGNFRTNLSRSQDVYRYFLFGGVLATAISATIGVTSLYLGGVVSFSRIYSDWRIWWSGDAIGALVVGSSILVAYEVSWQEVKSHWKELLIIELLLIGSLVLIFDWQYGRTYMVFPFTTLAAKRLKLRGAAMSVVTTSAFVIFETSQNIGAFANSSISVNLSQLELFIGAVAITSFILGAVAAERTEALGELTESNLLLDRRVEDQRRQIEEGHAVLVEALTRSLTQEHEAAEKLRELDQIRSDLVSTISHELRTPLTSIHGYLDLLMSEQQENLEQAQISQMMVVKRNADRLTRLVEDLLTLSRSDGSGSTLTFGSVVLSDLVEQVVDDVSGVFLTSQVSLHFEDGTQGMTISGDGSLLSEAISNLVLNAAKFTTPGGSVELATMARGDDLEVTVSDNGIGVAEADLPRIFDRFYRAGSAKDRAIGGTGLGLAIVKSIVEKHGGDISVNSTLGKGTTVTMSLPRLQAVPLDVSSAQFSEL